jgi:hypothetical protein
MEIFLLETQKFNSLIIMTKKEPTLQSFLDNGALLIQAYPTTVLSIDYPADCRLV